MEPQPEQEKDVLYARAATTGDEFRKNTLAFSVGALGVFFVSLTGEKAPNLSVAEGLVLLVALVAFAFATLSGLLAWSYSGKYFNEWATNSRDAADKCWHRPKNRSDKFLNCLFGIGVMASAAYLLLKIWPALIVSILVWLTMIVAGQPCGQGKLSAVDRMKQAQEALKVAGLYSGPIDGVNGRRTQPALRNFQARVGLPVTGALDEATFHRLVPPAPCVQDGAAASLAKLTSGGRQPVASGLPRRPQ